MWGGGGIFQGLKFLVQLIGSNPGSNRTRLVHIIREAVTKTFKTFEIFGFIIICAENQVFIVCIFLRLFFLCGFDFIGVFRLLGFQHGITVKLLFDSFLQGEDGKLENLHRLNHVRSELHPLL